MTAAGRPWDIAIVGMACRFPGAATPAAFWDNLVGGVESVTFFSDEELLAAGEDRAVMRHPHYVKAAPVLDAHDQFDEVFFGYAPREARLMDPQHRLFLEVAWEAFEDAGHDPLGVKGRVGVYAGAGGLVSSYGVRLVHPDLRGQTGDLGHIGNDRDFLCSRVSFKLNLTGPSVNVQSACSTSLVALHLACRALVDGEADLALAGASVVRVPHVRGYLAEAGGIYSVDGHCRAFDARASGTLFGSGVAAVLLKPLAAAVADGDRVYAVVKGSAVNNDGGQKVTYTASTASGQSRAVSEAMAVAGFGGDDFAFVECHGTATALGDPIEIQALTRAFRASTSRVGFCPIGSVKSNVGHLEQCAGMAGLLKAVLALQHGIVPPSLHLETPNPRIPFDRSPFEVATGVRPLGRTGRPRRAGVNSVGMGGTNAFVVLEEAPASPASRPPARPLCILTVSAPSPEALRAQIAPLRGLLAAPGSPALADVCFTRNRGRHHFGWRFAAIGGDRDEMLSALDRFPLSTSEPTGAARRPPPAPVVFLFPGQGSQYPRMGESLVRAEPAFRKSLERCWALFAAAGIPVADVVLADDAGRLQQTRYAQAALFSLQVALAELWQHWGISPGSVIGHSVGEFAAAVTAGVCSVEDAVGLVAGRARLMETLSERGAMLAVAGDAATLDSAWPQDRSDLAVAAVNAPDRHVVSGNASAVAIVAERLRRRGVPVTALSTSHAFHSPLMDPILDAFEALAAPVPFLEPAIPWISTLTGEAMTGAPTARYWRDQLRCPVRFRAALETAARSSAVFLEIGPGATLGSLGRRCVRAANGTVAPSAWLTSLARDCGEWSSLLDAVRELYQRGHTIRWAAFEPEGGRRVALPAYVFRRRRWWLESREPEVSPAQVVDPRTIGRHPFLGDRLGGEGIRFESLIDLRRHAFLADHRVFGRIVLPTTVVLEMVSVAAVRVLGFARPVVADFLYERALVLPADQPVWVHLVLEASGGRGRFRVESTGIDGADPWQVNATGTVREGGEDIDLLPFPSTALRDAGEIPASRFYPFVASRGLAYGRAFQGVTQLWRQGDEAFARVVLPDDLATAGHAMHPALLDACLHVYAALPHKYGALDRAPTSERRAYVPISLESFHLLRSGIQRAWVHASVLERDPEDEARLRLDIVAYDDDGHPAAAFRGVTIRETDDVAFGATPVRSLPQWLYRLVWRDVPRAEPTMALTKHWWILADAGGVADQLAKRLSAEGCLVHVMTTGDLAAGGDVTEAASFAPLLDRLPDDSVGVLYLWGLDVPVSTAADAGPPADADRLAGAACVGLLKALDRRRPRDGGNSRLWLVTRGAQAVPGDAIPGGLAQSPLWGLGRTVALEAPDLWGGVIDLPLDVGASVAAELLLAELKSGRAEDQIVLRGERRVAARFVRMERATLPEARQLRRDASYWIVGGLGRVGLKTAEALVDAGARHLVLSGRHTPGPETGAILERLGARAELVAMAADVSSPPDVQAVLAHIRDHMPPLKGVIHAAAVFDDGVLAKLEAEQWRRVLRPKMTGAWVLSQATLDHQLDFFVLFSSVLSLWGGLGQAAYTAANSFLDALVEFRRALGLPATVFNWGPWAGVGLAERWGPVSTALWNQRGTSTLPPQVCADALLRFLGGDDAQVVVCDTRWDTFLAQFEHTPPLFGELDVVRAEQRSVETQDGPEGPVDVVRRHVGHVLGLGGAVPLTQPLNELGLDSLLAVNLANRLRDALRVSVPTAALLKGPTILGLVAELFPDRPAPVAEPSATVDDRQPPTARVAGDGWLIVHRPNPAATIRLFCFPFAGGGAATFRAWPRHLDPRIELVAIEPPGRQTRIEEPPIRDLATFVARLVDALRPFLDKPFAVYGHCLGALTLFETVNALIALSGPAPVHVFVSGARTPDELHRPQEFEVRLMERLLKLPGYNLFEPIHRQPDEVFAEAILQFNVVATADLLHDPELRRLILPVIRADFEMSSTYRYTARRPWDIPITCMTGTNDAYVSPANASSWGRFTRRRLQLLMIETEHFLVVDDNEFVIQVLNRELGDAG